MPRLRKIFLAGANDFAQPPGKARMRELESCPWAKSGMVDATRKDLRNRRNSRENPLDGPEKIMVFQNCVSAVKQFNSAWKHCMAGSAT